MTAAQATTEEPKLRCAAIARLLEMPFMQSIAHSTDRADRLAYAHDTWCLSMRRSEAGDEGYLPDAVAWPSDARAVRDLVTAAVSLGVPLVPWGGGSGIVGGALAVAGGLIVDFKKMNRILEVDELSLTARVQPGIIVQHLEDRLNWRGYTSGHFPQSMHSATLGGSIAHRGAGFKSTGYGKIEDIVLGMDAVVAPGEIVSFKGIARHSNGPDLRHLFFGSEGTIGFVTEATIRIRPVPVATCWKSFRFGSLGEGIAGLRAIMQSGLLPTFVRLFDETQSPLAFSHLGEDSKGSILIAFWEAPLALAGFLPDLVAAICKSITAKDLGDSPAKWWWERSLSTAGLLRTQHMGDGWFSDTIEVASSWGGLKQVHGAMQDAMKAAAGPDGTVFGHIAHAYETGADMYMVFHGRAESSEKVEDAYRGVVEAAVGAAMGRGATLSHHHGIGIQRREFLRREYGDAGFRLLEGITLLADPTRTLNPGKLAKQ